jgi:hypothetical protein
MEITIPRTPPVSEKPTSCASTRNNKKQQQITTTTNRYRIPIGLSRFGPQGEQRQNRIAMMQSGICLAYLCPRTRPAVFVLMAPPPHRSQILTSLSWWSCKFRWAGFDIRKLIDQFVGQLFHRLRTFRLFGTGHSTMVLLRQQKMKNPPNKKKAGRQEIWFLIEYWTPLRWMDSLIGTSVSTVQLSTVVTCMHTLLNTRMIIRIYVHFISIHSCMAAWFSHVICSLF